MMSSSRHTALILALIAGVLALHAGCKSKQKDAGTEATSTTKPVDLGGLDAVPREVSAVVGMDVGALRRSWLVQRMVEQMFRRDQGLKQRIDALMTSCRVDPENIREVIIGLTRGSGPESGDGQAVMVVTGAFVEAELASCVGQSVAADGRRLVADRADGRTMYGVRRNAPPAGNNREAAGGGAPVVLPDVPLFSAGSATAHARDQVWFAVAGPETLVVATSKEFLRRALSPREDKVMSDEAMAGLIERVDRRAGVWVAGAMDPDIGRGLVDKSAGQVASPPAAMFGSVGLESGVDFRLGVDMATEEDAGGLRALISGQKGLWALAAQRFGLGEWIDKLRVDADARTVYLRVTLTQDELRQILARIDTSAGSLQNPADTQGGP